jgi:hypothetical protein
MKKVLLVSFVLVGFLLFPWGNAIAAKFFNEKLDLKGSVQQNLNVRTHRDVRDIQFSSFRSQLRLEGLLDLVKGPALNIKVYGLASYYYDEGLDVEADLRRAVRAEGGYDKYDDYKYPSHSEQWLKELYVDVRYENFTARIGKQMVSWGETAEARVADLINPLDLTYIISFPEWEDFKIGLWMARLFYKPEGWWQDLGFELIIIPFDFERTITPPAGSGLFLGAPPVPFLQNILDKQRFDMPSDGTSNFEIGMRIRGYATLLEGIDWTISHFYTRVDSPLVDEEEGFNNLTRIILGLGARGDVYTYPHYSSTAFTFTTTLDSLASDISGEIVYNSNRDYQFGSDPNASFKIKEKDLITSAVTIRRRTMVPYISDRLFWNRSRSVSFSLAWYQYHLLNHKHNKNTGEYIQWESGSKDSSWTKFTLGVSTGFFNDILMPVFCNISYNANGPTTISAGINFMPGDHWSWMAFYQQLNEAGIGRYQSQVILRMRYEF